MKYYLNKQSSIKLVTDKIIYIDPYELDNYDNADYIFITHEHYDHYSLKDISKIITENTKIIIPYKMKNKVLNDLQINENNIILVKPNNKYIVDSISFETTYSYNMNKPYHPKENEWVGYILNLENSRYYIMGDTDDLIENHNIKCDILFIPIGGTFTMNVNEAINFTKSINPKKVIPTHYGSIVGNIEDGIIFKEKLSESNIEVELLLK